MRHLVLMVGRSRGRFASYQNHLRTGGFQVLTARKAHEVLRLLTALRPTACIVDASPPDGDGWIVCEAIRSIPSLKSTSLLVIVDATRSARRTARARAKHLNCTLFSNSLKPTDFADGVAALIGLSHGH